MTTRLDNSNRSGISLTEILIGIMVLGIGVISLATLFPIGLLRVRRSVNDVRGTVEARSAWSELRVRNLLAPPHGPWIANPNLGINNLVGIYTPFSADLGGLHLRFNTPATDRPFRPTIGAGIPVALDPLWVLNNIDATNPIQYRLGVVDLDRNGTLDFIGGEGLFRTQGGVQNIGLASEIYASPDDVIYGDSETRRMVPYQAEREPGVAPGMRTPPFLSPTYGVPFYDSTGRSLPRERRYTWFVIARKSKAGQVYSAGYDGVLGNPDDPAVGVNPLRLADRNDLLDDHGPEAGPDGILGPAPNPMSPPPLVYDDPTYDDPARDMASGAPRPAPVGPFDVTIIVSYNRDFSGLVFSNNAFRTRDITFTNYLDLTAAQPIVVRPVPIFSPIARTITVNGVTYGPYGPREATLVRRSDGIPFPEIATGGFILDATFDGSTQDGIGPRGGHVYKVERKSLNSDGNILVLQLDRDARANGPLPTPLPPFFAFTEGQPPFSPVNPDPCGYVLTYLKSAVGVFEKQVP